MNTEQLTQLTISRNLLNCSLNIKMENILENIIIYIKDRKDDDEEFDYYYVYEALINILEHLVVEVRRDDVDYLTTIIYNNFEGCYDECYDLIVDFLERYRGETDDEHFDNDENIRNVIDSDDEDETNYNNYDFNQNYKFLTNISDYIGLLIYDRYRVINKIDFIESVIDGLNNQVVCLK